MKVLIVSGAYGRDYATPEAAEADWNAGLDFQVHSIQAGGKYVTRAEADALGFDQINIRYNKLQDVMVVGKAADDDWDKLD